MDALTLTLSPADWQRFCRVLQRAVDRHDADVLELLEAITPQVRGMASQVVDELANSEQPARSG